MARRDLPQSSCSTAGMLQLCRRAQTLPSAVITVAAAQERVNAHHRAGVDALIHRSDQGGPPGQGDCGRLPLRHEASSLLRRQGGVAGALIGASTHGAAAEGRGASRPWTPVTDSFPLLDAPSHAVSGWHRTGPGSSGAAECRLRRGGEGPAAMPIVERLELLVHLQQLVANRFALLDAGQGQQHGLHLGFAVDQHTALAGAGFVRHCCGNRTQVVQLESAQETVAAVTAGLFCERPCLADHRTAGAQRPPGAGPPAQRLRG
jgi:hypothetical protein